MRLTVSHRTEYRFEAPVRGVVQSLRLQPADSDSQIVGHWAISSEGGTLGAAFRDGAGDWVQTLSFHEAVEGVVVEVSGLVETADRNGVLSGYRELVHPAVYLRPTRATAASLALQDLAGAAVGASVLDRAHALSRAVTEAVDYTPGATHAETTAAAALEAGAGVCQDHAHVLIAAAILAGIPARYVTGYLHAEAGDAMAEASHAWAELYVEGLGWVGFDASNATCPDERYVRLGSGFDALDAAPIRGLVLGEADERMTVDVSVTQAQQQSQS